MTQVNGAAFLLAGLLVLFVYLLIEKWRLDAARRMIPIRVHVNGTRGKSSTTRLISAALRAHIPTIAKTTGTLPRMIGLIGEEHDVARAGPPNISEQIRTIMYAARKGARALVLECMALRPEFQTVSEVAIVQATIAVLTNIRPDHLDVMGPNVEDVGLALAGMIPRGGVLITAERDLLPLLERVCKERNTRLIAVSASEDERIPMEAMAQFSYYEHRENVALALAVAQELGLSREHALQGMWNATPDPGALCAMRMNKKQGEWLFVNAFAANDPQSNRQIASLSCNSFPDFTRLSILLNLRSDRSDRSVQMAEMICAWPEIDQVILMGSGSALAEAHLRRANFKREKIVMLGDLPAQTTGELILEKVPAGTLLIGMGNIGGNGMGLVEFFRNQGEQVSGAAFYQESALPTPHKRPELVASSKAKLDHRFGLIAFIRSRLEGAFYG